MKKSHLQIMADAVWAHQNGATLQDNPHPIDSAEYQIWEQEFMDFSDFLLEQEVKS